MSPLDITAGLPRPHDLASQPAELAARLRAAPARGAVAAGTGVDAGVDARAAGELARSADAVRQFEAMFLGQLFAEMRKTVEAVADKSSFGSSYFNAMLDEQLAQACAESGDFGLGTLLGGALDGGTAGPQVPPRSVDGPVREGTSR